MKNKEEIIARLTAIIREITCMNSEEFGRHLQDGTFGIEFDNHSWGEPTKVKTYISMQKINVSLEDE